MKKSKVISVCLIASMLMTSISWMQLGTKADALAGLQVSNTSTELQNSVKPDKGKEQANSFAEKCVSIIPSLKLTPNYGWTIDGEWVSQEGNEAGYGKMVATAPDDYVPVAEGETYVITTNRIYWIYNKGTHILFTDDNMKPVKCDDIDYTQNLSDKVTHVPAGATRMYITYYCNQTFRVDKIVGSMGNKDAETLVREESEITFDAVRKEETADKEFSYKFDKAKVTFVLDDVRGDVNLVYDIFKDYGIKNICIAAVPDNFSQIASGASGIRRETMDEIVANGGEILAHYGDQLKKDTYTKTQIRKRFKETKEKLESFGYDINGIILAGGVGFDSIDFNDVEKWARYYYDYSDLYGMNEPYRRGRASLAYSYTTQARFEEAINNTMDKKSWMILYMHDLSEMPEDKLRERLTYIKKCVDAGNVDIATYKKVNDDFGIKNNGTLDGEYSAADYLAREDMEGYLAYSDQKKIENGVNEYYTENLLQDNSVECKDIYISSSTGDDSNEGTIDAPKKSLKGLSKANNLHIFLKAGDTFALSESFVFGNNVSMNSYNEAGEIGIGKRPILSGWDELNGTWTKTTVPNVWELDFSSISKLVTNGKLNGNTGMLKVNGAVNFERYVFGTDVDTSEYARKIAELEQEVLVKEGQFIPFWTVDSTNSKIYLYSGVNPNEEEIEYGAPFFGMSIGNVSNVGVNHVEITGFSKHGVSMSGASKVNVTDCYINHIGGGFLNEGNLVRYGNAIEVWANGKDIYVGENVANWIFDTAYTNQTTGSNITQENITFERNIANRCFWGLESWGDNCNPKGFKNITYHNNVVTNVCDVTRPDLECYYGNGFTNYNENGEAMDSVNPYISCRTGGYYFSQMAGISAAVSNDKTNLTFSRNAILFSNRYTAILSTTATGKFPTMQSNLMYSSLPNDSCKMVRGKTPEDTFFSFYEEVPGEKNKVIAEHGAELLYYSDTLKNVQKYMEQCYEYPIVKITSITFDVDKKLFEKGSTLDCNVVSAKFEYNDGSMVDIDKSKYVFDTSAVDMNKAGTYKVSLKATNPEDGKQLKAEITVKVSDDLSLFVWDEGVADGGKTKWSIRKNGDLYIESGSSNYGGVAQYTKASDTPWYSYCDKIENVYINQAYHYAANFFDDKAAIKKIYINANVSGNINFGATPDLEDIIIADGVTVNSISLNGNSKITSYDFSKIKNEVNAVQTLKDTALEEVTLYSLPKNSSALYRNLYLRSVTIVNAPENKVGLADAFLHVNGWNKADGVERLYVSWSKDEVENAPWGLKGNFIISYKDYDVTYVNGVATTSGEHEYGTWVSNGKVSCTQDGTLTRTCKICGGKDEIVEEKLGHDYVGGKCSRCGKVSGTFSETTSEEESTKHESSLVGESSAEHVTHDFSKYVSNKNGTHKVVCKDCDAVQEGHDKDACSGGTATCTAKAKCRKCKTEYGSLKAHTNTTTTTKATLDTDGKTVTKCSVCGKSTSATIYCPKTFTLSKTSCEYTGSQIKPTITIKDGNGVTVAAINYTVTYGKNKAVGKGTVKVAFKDSYTGTKTVEFKITPKKTTIGTPAIAADRITVKWTKNTTGCGYYIYRSVNGAGYTKVKTITSNATVSWKDTGAKKNGTKYQYKIYAYKTVNSTTYKSPVSAVKTTYFVSRPAISTFKVASKAFTVKWGKNSKATGYQIQYSTKSDFSSRNKIVTSASTASKKISNLKAKKKYYVKVRTYKTVSGTKYYSEWSATKSVITK